MHLLCLEGLGKFEDLLVLLVDVERKLLRGPALAVELLHKSAHLTARRLYVDDVVSSHLVELAFNSRYKSRHASNVAFALGKVLHRIHALELRCWRGSDQVRRRR
jgi:hypothetical protein